MINKIHLGDCLDLLPKLDDNSVDLIVTSPPYNVGMNYANHFDMLEWDDYLEWTEKWLTECYRVLKDDGRICVNHLTNQVDRINREINRFPIMDIRNIQEKIGYNVHKLIIWDDKSEWSWKSKPEEYLDNDTELVSAKKPFIRTPYESILISSKKDWTKFSDGIDTISESEFKKATKQVWKIPTTEGHKHIASWGTLELPKRCIELLSYQNDVVLDPFSGGGSTALVCKETNRQFIGFDVSRNSVDLTNQRLLSDWKPPTPVEHTNDHVIITSGRSGSFLLSAILNMHPNCVNRGEILGEMRNLFVNEIFWKHPDYLIENFWLKDYKDVVSKGFKFLYFQDLKRNEKVSEFLKEKKYKVIHLKRRNRLKKYISFKKVYENQGDWGDNYLVSNSRNPWLNGKVEVDIDDLLNKFRIDEEQEKIYDDKFPDCLEIYYEDMVSDFDLNFTNQNNKTIQKCFEYLDLDYQELITNKKGVNSFLKETDFLALESYDLENYTGKIKDGWFDIGNKDFILRKSRILTLDKCISNYDEVKEKLNGTKYSHYIETSISYSESEMKDKLYNLLTDNNVDIDVLKKNKVLLKGGAVLRLFMNLPLDTDLDFYFLDQERMENVDNYFSKNRKLLHKSPTCKKYQCDDIVVDIIRHKKLIGTYEEMVKDFDFTISTAAYDFGLEKFIYPQEFIDDLNNKKISLNTTISKERAVVTLHRVDKYKELGFTFPKELYNKLKKDSKLGKTNDLYIRLSKMSWLRDEELFPVLPNIDTFVNWLMDIKSHQNFDKFNYYLFGGFISWPEKPTKDIDILISKRDGECGTLEELETIMVDMFDLAYDIHGFFIDTFYMRRPQWIGDYPRDENILRSVEQKGLWVTITKNRPEYSLKFRRYGKLNCCYRPSFTNWWDNDSDMINRWVNLDAKYARMVDLRKIIKYYENDKERDIKDFLNEFQEYSGY